MPQDDYGYEKSDWLFIGPSEINGFGLFSRKTISSGAIVGRLGGAIQRTPNKRTIQIDRDRHLCSDFIDFVNHNCRPSAYIRVESETIVLNAISEINRETSEISIDYNCSEYSLAESFMCRCCRKANHVAGYKYLIETNQKEYLRRIRRFALSHLLQMAEEVRTTLPKPQSH
ncbi:SET domain-containing protein [Bradyrhizobium sp. IC4061]|uniref:SET domain-containing protein n=1 Tax=Bradyrhizobium sp. IC4061 TaxID=2793808 RepID=UPI0034E2E3CD